jgi:hypothetical protein
MIQRESSWTNRFRLSWTALIAMLVPNYPELKSQFSWSLLNLAFGRQEDWQKDEGKIQ